MVRPILSGNEAAPRSPYTHSQGRTRAQTCAQNHGGPARGGRDLAHPVGRPRPGRRSGRRARAACQPAVGHHRRRAGDLHAGRLRAGRDRLLPSQARRPRRVDELRDLRARLHRLLLRRLPVRVRRARQQRLLRVDAPVARSGAPDRLGQLDVPLAGRLGAVGRRHHRRHCSASSSTWSPSWTPPPRSRPGRWPSAGSGAAS